MNLFRQNFKLITLVSTFSTILIFFLLSTITFANETDSDIARICTQQSLTTAAEIRSELDEELTKQDMRMLRLGAINACKNTYRRLGTSNSITPTRENVANKSDTSGEITEVQKSPDTVDNKKESIIDRLLRTEKKEDVSPMQKRHRTGGK